MTNQELISLFEHIRYQIVVFPKDASTSLPQSVGSGFILDYRGHSFFVTADHVVNTHDHGIRKIENHLITISTNKPVLKDGKPQTIMIPIGDIYFFDQLNVDVNNGTIDEMPLFDAAFCILQDWQVNTECLTCEVKIEGANVPLGEKKKHLKETDIIDANKLDIYSVYGRVKFALDSSTIPNIEMLTSQQTFKTGLKLVGEDSTQNYYVLQSPQDVVYEEWAGLSGSAVLNQDGKLIGIICAVDTSKNRYIYVKKIQRVLPLMDAAILENQQYDNSTHASQKVADAAAADGESEGEIRKKYIITKDN